MRLNKLRLTLSLFGAMLACACSSPERTPPDAATPMVTPPPTLSPTQEATMTPQATPSEEESPSGTSGGLGVPDADVEFVRATLNEGGAWTFSVTVSHPDTGWEDYADGWDVVTPDGTVLKPDAGSPFTRLLLHPHETEQPFTRSQSGIALPQGVTQVTVRAHDIVDGFGGREVVVDLAAESGANFEVVRP